MSVSIISAVLICFNSAFCRSAVKTINKAFALKGFRSFFPDCIKVIKVSAFVDAVVKIDNHTQIHAHTDYVFV